ncbi:MAG: bifunctional protein-serine/threonine kinase/phosphatase [Burkholderiales bacterium]
MPLEFAIGHATRTGKRERNEDFVGVVTPEADELSARGALLAVADGVSGEGAGREAAEYTVRGLLADYYATPETWEIPQSVDRVLSAINRWMMGQGAVDKSRAGMATTLSLLILRGNRYTIGHVGDTRVYRLRHHEMALLTQDHVWDRPDMRHVLKRAVGLDQHLMVDYSDGELLPKDRLMICSDGVWEPLGNKRIHELMLLHEDPQRMADALVDAALDAGSTDNATALAARIDAVAAEGWRDMLGAYVRLPVPPRLKLGGVIDGFEVLSLIHESRATLLYKVRSLSNKAGQVCALKTLQPAFADDRASCEGLLGEEWLAKRLVSKHFPQVVPVAASARHHLYYVMTFHTGATLQQHLDSGKHFTVADAARIGAQIARALGALHRLSIIHRDIKPANLLQDEGNELRVLDMGVAFAAGVPYPELQGNPGTPSYMAPELFAGEKASEQSDLYAAGASLYYLLTRKYPYGEVEPFQHPRFADPTPPTRYRPDIPQWLENVLLRAVARDQKQRFETAEEMLLALERGGRQPVSAPLRTPLAQRPAALWQAIALVSIVLNLLLLYVILVR